jgi:D-psicose/D-tagatose/L-ribulose 3-epimerase
LKFSVSNISFEPESFAKALPFIKKVGGHGLELAPGLLFEDYLHQEDSAWLELRDKIQAEGLKVFGFHGLFFAQEKIALFADDEQRQNVEAQLIRLARGLHLLGGGTMVFGSPGTRIRYGKSTNECFALSVDFFRRVCHLLKNEGYDVKLVVEPLAPNECEFLHSLEEGLSLATKVDSEQFGLHLDLKALLDQGLDVFREIETFGAELDHVHMSVPGLGPMDAYELDHISLAGAFAKGGYDGVLSLEMRRGHGDDFGHIERSLGIMNQYYA